MDVVRARSFGTVAEDYERYRPGYPRELVEIVLARLPEIGPRRPRALEIGAGTGKATRMFAAAGVEVTAIEPDPQMLEVLRRECAGLPVTSMMTSFEEFEVETPGEYDLVYAGAALHWTRSAGRWDRVAGLLGPGGVVASFGGPNVLADPRLVPLAAELEYKYGVQDGIEIVSSLPTAGSLAWPGNELAADARFTEVEELTIPRELDLEIEDWIAYLNTVSAYRVLDDEIRAALFGELAGRMPQRVRVNVDLVAHLARLADGVR